MSKMFRTHQNTIGNLVIALLFVGGCIFLLTGSWDTSETEAAKGCCGGVDTTSVAETTGGCCGGQDTTSSIVCNCVGKSCPCSTPRACGGETQNQCPPNNSCTNTESPSDPCVGLCDGSVCNEDDDSVCNGDCS